MAALTCLGVQNNEAILLVGQTGCGKTTLAQLLSYVLKRPFYSINCHKHTQAGDLLGSLRPSSDPNSNSRFQFVNGVVIEAMLNGGILLIDEINTAEDSVLQRLNEVLQSSTIGVQRGLGWQSIKAKQGFCIIATMNPSGDYGKKELSPALRNRFTQIWVQPITTPHLIIEAKTDITTMISAKLKLSNYPQQVIFQISHNLFEFIKYYNCILAQKYNLSRKRLTMRDIGWICKFIVQTKSNFNSQYKNSYYWALNILAIQGLKFIMNDSHHQSVMLDSMKVQLVKFIQNQCNMKNTQSNSNELEVIQILKNMDFPLMIKTDLPLALLGLQPQNRIFFSSHTDLSDLLGQFQPVDKGFIWKDQQLLKNIRNGGRTALMDLNLAQQQVIEGINSLFDYRGSIFVVQLNQTVIKHKDFKPMVILKYTAGNQRKGLPNSFLNRFVKVCIDNVSIQTKLAYLKNKYNTISQNLIKIITKIFQQQPNYSIQKVQFLCQVCSKSPLQLAKCLQLLDLHKKNLNIDQNNIIDSNNNNYSYEQKLLALLPLIKQYDLKSAEDMKHIQKVNVIYSLSKFSACLIGDCKKRDRIVQFLSLILNKKVVKIILSTMTDMNDLLGSYQQIVDQEQSQSSMRQQRNLSNAFIKTQINNTQGKKTKFIYQQSTIIKTLKDNQTLLYIQVPNQILLQRVEKGLIDIYQQTKQIIIGIDNVRQTKSNNNTKFIPIHLNLNEQNPHISENINKTLQFFPENLSQLTHLNQQIRIKQLSTCIESLIINQSSRPNILAYKRMLYEIGNYSLNSVQSQKNLIEKQQKCRNKKIKQLPFKFIQNAQIQQSEQYYTQVTKQVLNYQISDYNQYRQSMLLKSFLSSTLDQVNKLTSFYGKSQQKLTQTISNFQTLFTCNINNFQLTSLKILSVIFSLSLSYEQSLEMLTKFSTQIDRLYEELFRDKIKQIIINFNDEQTKIIPIITNQETVKYLFKENNLSIKLLADVAIKYSYSLKSSIEKSIIEVIQNLKINEQEVSQWVIGMKLKDLKQYEILQNKIKNKSTILPEFNLLELQIKEFMHKVLPEISSQLLSIQSNDQPTRNSQQTCLILSQKLLTLFKPSENIAQNISIHIRSQIQYQTLKQVISDDLTYLNCYKQICQLKYLNLQPKKLLVLSKSIQQYQNSLSILSKSLIYRGHDNIKSLLQFYYYFINSHINITNSNYNPQTIKLFLIQSYSMFYSNFNDILLPYYISMIVLYKSRSKVNHNQSLVVQILRKEQQDNHTQSELHPVFKLMEEMSNNQNQQNDRAKDYIRYQRKFNKTVIIDQYSQQGVEKNKQLIQQQFNQLFGRNQLQQHHSSQPTFIDRIFNLLNKQSQQYYNILTSKLHHHTYTYQQLIISLSLTTSNQKIYNIYEQRSTQMIKQLISKLPKMMSQVEILLNKYKIDTLKQLAGLLGKVYQHKTYKDQIYKVLVDCQFIIQKSFQLNSILPVVERVPCDQLIAECLKIRRVQLKNWKSMLYFKQKNTKI